MRLHRAAATALAAALITVGTTATMPSAASAQMSMGRNFEEVDAKPKGTIGLGMIGAELGFVIPAVAGLDQWWSLTIFPAAGAAGGATAGWFLIDEKGQEEAAVAVLASGIALVIPSLVATLAATRYDPADEVQQAAPAGGGGGQGAVQAQGSASGGDGQGEAGGSAGGGVGAAPEPTSRKQLRPDALRARRVARAGPGLLRWSDREGLLLTVPGVSVVSDRDPQTPYLDSPTRVHVPVVTGAF